MVDESWKQDPAVRRLIFEGARFANSLFDAIGIPKQVQTKTTDIVAAVTADYKNAYQGVTPNGRTILFFPMRSAPGPNLIETTLMHALALRGFTVNAFLPGTLLPAHDTQTILNERPGYIADQDRWATRYLRNARVPFGYLGDFVGDADVERARSFAQGFGVSDFPAAVFDGVAVGRICYASVIRFFLRGTLPDEPRTREVIRDYLTSAVINAIAGRRIFERYRPEKLIISHGYYMMWGVFTALADQMGIPYVVQSFSYRLNTLMFTGGGNFWDVLLNEPDECWRGSIRNDEQRKEILDYLESRRAGTKDTIQYNPDAVEDSEAIRRELGLADGKTTFGLFTNLNWDGAVMGRATAFPDMNTWLIETIRHFARHPEKQLVIRAHPAELVQHVETQEKTRDIIREGVGTLPGNVYLIDSDSKLSSYALAELLDAGIVYSTKVGLEFAVRGLPMIVAGEAYYMGKGFTYDAVEAGEYFAYLDDPEVAKPLTGDRVELALDYARYYFFRRMIPFPLFEPGTFDPTYKRLADLKPGACPELDYVCDCLSGGREMILP